MGRGRDNRKASPFEEIDRLKTNRRADVIKCAAALTVIVVLIGAKSMLEANGIMESGNLFAGAFMMFSAVGLAIFAGAASTDFTKCGHHINDICTQGDITKDDIKKDDIKKYKRQ